MFKKLIIPAAICCLVGISAPNDEALAKSETIEFISSDCSYSMGYEKPRTDKSRVNSYERYEKNYDKTPETFKEDVPNEMEEYDPEVEEL